MKEISDTDPSRYKGVFEVKEEALAQEFENMIRRGGHELMEESDAAFTGVVGGIPFQPGKDSEPNLFKLLRILGDAPDTDDELIKIKNSLNRAGFNVKDITGQEVTTPEPTPAPAATPAPPVEAKPKYASQKLRPVIASARLANSQDEIGVLQAAINLLQKKNNE